MTNVTAVMQDLFNRAYIGLRNQGFEQSIYKGSCMYRDMAQRKCAVGHLIADDKEANFFDLIGSVNKCMSITYENDNQDQAIRFMKAIGIEPMDAQSPEAEAIQRFLDRMQKAHDHHGHPDQMKASLTELAQSNGLQVPA